MKLLINNLRQKRIKHIFSKTERKVILAASLGTAFEWYDFYLYASLVPILAKHFFSKLDQNSAFIFTLLTFAVGFLVRPIGAMIFGRLGDLKGRKYTFLITITMMGLVTVAIGTIPSYETIGIMAPIILISLRILQGMAIGGEYGGAAIYVAEHAPQGQRGKFTGWIQITTHVGLLFALFVILVTRGAMNETDFMAWGWRIPFLFSLVLLIISIWIRLSLQESPAFIKMKIESRHSTAPLTEVFSKWVNLKSMILAIFGLVNSTAIMGIMFAAFVSSSFLIQTLKLDYYTTNILFAGAVLFCIIAMIAFANLSDIIGRKIIIATGDTKQLEPIEQLSNQVNYDDYADQM